MKQPAETFHIQKPNKEKFLVYLAILNSEGTFETFQ